LDLAETVNRIIELVYTNVKFFKYVMFPLVIQFPWMATKSLFFLGHIFYSCADL